MTLPVHTFKPVKTKYLLLAKAGRPAARHPARATVAVHHHDPTERNGSFRTATGALGERGVQEVGVGEN